jgi:hypothetical protein
MSILTVLASFSPRFLSFFTKQTLPLSFFLLVSLEAHEAKQVKLLDPI